MYNYYNYNTSDYMIPAGIPDKKFMGGSKSKDAHVLPASEGFIKGNLFSDLYMPYLKAEPFKLMPCDEREALLNRIQELNFAIIDLNLYLDNHPDDTEKIKLFNHYRIQEEQATRDYENKYGPLSLRSDALNSYSWTWLIPPWPWEVR